MALEERGVKRRFEVAEDDFGPTCDELFSREKNGRFRSIYPSTTHISESQLPTTIKEVVSLWQQYDILPQVINGKQLDVRTSKRNGNKFNENLAFKLLGGKTSRYRSIVPPLISNAKISILEINNYFYEFSLDSQIVAIATKKGFVKTLFKPNGEMVKSVNNESILHYRRIYQSILIAHEKFIKPIKLGGPRVEVEADCGKLGRDQKGGVGHPSYNKCFVFFMGEREGNVFFDVFANPGGGPERLSHIKPYFDEILLDNSITLVDCARAYYGYVLDNPEKQLLLCRANHSKANTEGFIWTLYLDEDDGDEFSDLTDGDWRKIDVGTPLADGMIGNLKKWLNSKHGPPRDTMLGWVKEFQFRKNYNGHDLYLKFLEIFGEVSAGIRRGDFTVNDVRQSIEWDQSPYFENPIDFDEEIDPNLYYEDSDGDYYYGEYYNCPGCDAYLKRSSKAGHRKRCKYYLENPIRIYDHKNSRCSCCVHPYHSRNKTKTMFRNL